MLIPVELNGTIVWMWDPPDVCTAGHTDGTLMRWHRCPDCSQKDTAWECARRDCTATGMDWHHVCGGTRRVGRGYPRSGGWQS